MRSGGPIRARMDTILLDGVHRLNSRLGLRMVSCVLLMGCGPRTLTAILPAPVHEAGPPPDVEQGVPDAAIAADDCSGPEPTGALAERPPMGWNGWNHFKCDS